MSGAYAQKHSRKREGKIEKKSTFRESTFMWKPQFRSG